MKVGILTFHNTLNHGASLQSYALQQSIKNMGVDCKIIDYTNDFIKNRDDVFVRVKNELKNKKIYSVIKIYVGYLLLKLRWLQFSKFYKHYLHWTDESFISSDESKSLTEKFDKFIVGSDQVWNYNLTGADPAYFLDFVDKDSRKIAYAASFGLLNIPDNLIKVYSDNLKKIKYLSTRESYGCQLVKNLIGKDAELVLDPVFLLDKEKWLSLCDNNVKKDKYIFCYTTKLDQWSNFLTQTKFPINDYKIYKLSILTIKDFINPKVKISFCISPIKFISLISGANLVVSASFHCIAMAIILNVPFVAILTGDQGKDERLFSILKIAGLENRILNKGMDINDINKPIDFLLVEEILKKYKNKSLDFLKNAVFS